MDYPAERSNHTTPTPKGAGLIIIPIVAISTLIFFYFFLQPLNQWALIFFLCFFLVIISFIDDIKNLSIKSRLLLQALIVGLSLFIYYESVTTNLLSLPVSYEGYFPLINFFCSYFFYFHGCGLLIFTISWMELTDYCTSSMYCCYLCEFLIYLWLFE